jgi:hypothetical protein
MVYGDPRKLLMRIPEELLSSVVFLVTKEPGEQDCDKKCRGTAFFVGMWSEANKDWGYPYLVTAKHNIAKAKKDGLELYVRINRTDEKSEDIRIDGDWIYPDDPSVDLAVLLFSPGKPYWYMPLAQQMQADESRLQDLGVGIGDEIVIAGLFTRRTGREKNLPIVRFGNIAAMPEEPLYDSKTGLDYQAYLIEARSFGGLSGSPVFVYFGGDRMVSGVVREQPPKGYRMLILLGILRGHWEHEEPVPFASAFSDESPKINWGIAVVTPATELLKLLRSEEFVKVRRKLDREHARIDGPTEDFAETTKRFTKEDFEAALKRASRKKTDET